jgi:hypothetical protein
VFVSEIDAVFRRAAWPTQRKAFLEERDFGFGSIATGPSKRQVHPCPLCPPESGGKISVLASTAMGLCGLMVEPCT